MLLAAGDVLGFEVGAMTHHGPLLRLYDRRLNVFEVLLGDDAELRPLLGELGLVGPAGVVRAAAQPLVSQWETTAALGAVAAATFLTLRTWGPVLVPLLGVLVFISLAATSSTVVVGDDGVHARWLWRRIRMPIAQITHVVAGAQGVFLRTSRGVLLFRMDLEATSRVAARVQAAIDAAREASPAALAVRLERGEDSFETWMRRLRGLLTDSSYRNPAASSTALRLIVEDVHRKGVERVAAAVALASEEKEGRPFVLGVARSTADPELRDALSTVASSGTVDEAMLQRLS
jgi:hypothetical protein